MAPEQHCEGYEIDGHWHGCGCENCEQHEYEERERDIEMNGFIESMAGVTL
jgi:hypothetical protein